MIEEQQNNPLHGLKLELLLTQLVECYGWDILSAALRLNCFKTNQTIKASHKFLKETQWAREKVEAFYLYRYARMPKPDDQEYALAPRERGFRLGIVPREPMILTLESIALSQAKAASAFKEKQSGKSRPSDKAGQTQRGQANKSQPSYDPSNPWNK